MSSELTLRVSAVLLALAVRVEIVRVSLIRRFPLVLNLACSHMASRVDELFTVARSCVEPPSITV